MNAKVPDNVLIVPKLTYETAQAVFENMCLNDTDLQHFELIVGRYRYRVNLTGSSKEPVTDCGFDSSCELEKALIRFFDRFSSSHEASLKAVKEVFYSGATVISSLQANGVDINRPIFDGERSYRPVARAANLAMRRMGRELPNINPHERNDTLLLSLIHHRVELPLTGYAEHNELSHVAAYLGDPAMLGIALQKGLNPNKANQYGWTPLMFLAHKPCMTEGDRKCLDLLLKNNADVNVKNKQETALYYAAIADNKEMAIRLIEKGAKLNPLSPNWYGSLTPLQCALLGGKPEMSAILANPELKAEIMRELNQAKDPSLNKAILSKLKHRFSEQAIEASQRQRGAYKIEYHDRDTLVEECVYQAITLLHREFLAKS